MPSAKPKELHKPSRDVQDVGKAKRSTIVLVLLSGHFMPFGNLAYVNLSRDCRSSHRVGNAKAVTGHSIK